MTGDRKRVLYEWYKSHHICTQCLREDATPGRTLCPDCAEKNRDRAARRRAAKRDEINLQQKQRNLKLRENGLCRCGRPARPGKALCIECAVKDNRKTIERRHARGQTMPLGLRKELHICLRCQKPAVEGYCYCEEHRAKQREHMAKAIADEKRQEAIEYWKRTMILPRRG